MSQLLILLNYAHLNFKTHKDKSFSLRLPSVQASHFVLYIEDFIVTLNLFVSVLIEEEAMPSKRQRFVYSDVRVS